MSFTPGVTGFFGPRDLLIEPLDPGEFRTLVYTFVRLQYGRVLALEMRTCPHGTFTPPRSRSAPGSSVCS